MYSKSLILHKRKLRLGEWTYVAWAFLTMCGQVESWTQDHLTRLPCYVKLTSFPYISRFFTLQWSIEHPLYGRHYPRHWVNSGEKTNETSAFEGAYLPVASLTHQWNVWPKIRTRKKKLQGSAGESAWHQAGGIGRAERKGLSFLSMFTTEKARTEWWKIFLRARKSKCETSMGRGRKKGWGWCRCRSLSNGEQKVASFCKTWWAVFYSTHSGKSLEGFTQRSNRHRLLSA